MVQEFIPGTEPQERSVELEKAIEALATAREKMRKAKESVDNKTAIVVNIMHTLDVEKYDVRGYHAELTETEKLKASVDPTGEKK